MARQLSLAFRPQAFSEMVGQEKLLKLIRGHFRSGRVPAAWMFAGETGSGKTTLARIMALSLQCKHQGQFGEPCRLCVKARGEFDIVEVNASEVSGVPDVEKVIIGSAYEPRPPSSYRVYILDEAQRLSTAAQNLLLKYFEDSPKTTVWMVCTTEPGKILKTLRTRCVSYNLQALEVKGIYQLVTEALHYVKSDYSPGPLADALVEQGVTSPRLVVQAVEKYLAGADAEKAALVGADSSVDTLEICRALVKGEWNVIRQTMMQATVEDARAIRAAVGGYLRTVLLETGPGKMADHTAEAIRELGRIGYVDDGLQIPTTAAVLYQMCRYYDHR